MQNREDRVEPTRSIDPATKDCNIAAAQAFSGAVLKVRRTLILVSRFDTRGRAELNFPRSSEWRVIMIRNSAKIVSDALSLPPRSRAKLAERLLESLEDPKQKEIDRLWADEVEDRIDAYERGELKAIPGQEVFRRLKPRKKK